MDNRQIQINMNNPNNPKAGYNQSNMNNHNQNIIYIQNNMNNPNINNNQNYMNNPNVGYNQNYMNNPNPGYNQNYMNNPNPGYNQNYMNSLNVGYNQNKKDNILKTNNNNYKTNQKIPNNHINKNINNNNMINMNNINNNNFKQNDENWNIKFLKKADNDFYDTLPTKDMTILTTPNVTIHNLINNYRSKSHDDIKDKIFVFKDYIILNSLLKKHLIEVGLKNCSEIYVYRQKLQPDKKTINIKLINASNNLYQINFFSDLSGFLKLFILKKIALKLDNKHFQNLSFDDGYIMEILKNGYSKTNPPYGKKNNDYEYMIENLNNFSHFIDNKFDSKRIQNISALLEKEDLKEISDLSYRAYRYNEFMNFLDNTLQNSIKQSIFEFSIESYIIIERPDYEIFIKEREKYPNKEGRILFYGTNIIPNPNSNIFNYLFEELRFTDCIDYCWFFSNPDTLPANRNRIPHLREGFNIMACYVYYDKNNNNSFNATYRGGDMEILAQPTKNKFCGIEYKIGSINQICPLISFKLKRNEFCIIWHDGNFSSNNVDQKFKDFLEGMKYKEGKNNLYRCSTVIEALSLVEKKKYNKIVLISSVGSKNEGVEFIQKARQIIGNDELISLFVAYNIKNLEWIQKCKNTLFSNESRFIEKYLKCFSYDCYEYERINIILKLIKEMEEFYNKYIYVKFNFNRNFLKFPNFKKEGKYSELSF